MLTEPAIKRAVAFIDGQNLFYAAKNAFGYIYPNYDASALAETICKTRNWNLTEIRKSMTSIKHSAMPWLVS